MICCLLLSENIARLFTRIACAFSYCDETTTLHVFVLSLTEEGAPTFALGDVTEEGCIERRSVARMCYLHYFLPLDRFENSIVQEIVPRGSVS